MRRIAFAFLCSFAFVSFAFLTSPAKAGEYYGEGSYRHRHHHSSYSTNCCYRKVVRHEHSVRYERLRDEGYNDGYHQRSRHHHHNYNRSYRRGYDSDYRPRRHYVGSYNEGYRGYARSCHWRRVQLADARGGWVWGAERVCY